MARVTTQKLTDKQVKLVDEYLIDLNGTAAAIRAGYSRSTANEIAAETLAKPHVRAYLAERQAALAKRTEITQEMVIKGLLDNAKKGAELDERGAPINLPASNQAWGLLGKHLGLFVEKSEVKVTLDDVRKLSDEELERLAAGE